MIKGLPKQLLYLEWCNAKIALELFVIIRNAAFASARKI